MKETKEKILLEALKLFARDGYEAVTTSDIAGALGVVKSALYSHYKNKQDILDSIVARMNEIDQERAKNFDAEKNNSIEKIKIFTEAQFRFWTEDEFARDFRKMMTLEQYRNPQMAELYQKIFVNGPVTYFEYMFREMIEQGILAPRNSELLALEFYAPFFLLMSVADSPVQGEETAAERLMQCVGRFIRQNAVE